MNSIDRYVVNKQFSQKELPVGVTFIGQFTVELDFLTLCVERERGNKFSVLFIVQVDLIIHPLSES